ncbi:MAG: response regulator transcription factor [Bacteroidales bacterium]|nr:response regulator transcription factor [Bacteroidales bacterium]
MQEILIVEDDADVRDILTFNIENAGYSVIAVVTAEEGLKQMTPQTALILLDVMLPGMSGFQFARQLRTQQNNTPIIFLTAKTEENDLLTGFSTGGDDYIFKPFSINVVLARIKAVLKRFENSPQAQRPSLQFGDLVVNTQSAIVTLKGELVDLSRKEYDILVLLCTHPGTYFSRTAVIAELWKDAPYVLDRTVDVHIAHIRNKLDDYRDFIKNRAGFGYYIESL